MWARKPRKKETHLFAIQHQRRASKTSKSRHVMTELMTAERANTAPGLRGSWCDHWESLIRLFCIFHTTADSVAPVQYPKKYFHKINRDLYGDAMLVPIRLVCTKWNSTVELRCKWYWIAIRRSQLHSILLVPSSILGHACKKPLNGFLLPVGIFNPVMLY